MSYLKFKAPYLFTGNEMLGEDAVLVCREDGTIEAIISASDAGDQVQQMNGILSPGFVNCHCHLELSHMKGIIPEKTGMVDFLLSVIKQRNFPQEVVLQAIADAERDMIDKGIVAVGDICNTTGTVPQKKRGNLHYHNFIEATGFNDATATLRFEACLEIFRAFELMHNIPPGSNSIAPHAPYSVSGTLFKRIAGFPGNHLLTIHNQESGAENEFLQLGTGDFKRLYTELGIDISSFVPTGKRSLETYLPYFNAGQSIVLVHNTATEAEDVAFAKTCQANLFFCLCPNANEYITGMVPDVDMLLKNGCTVTLGTDSLASNHQLDILEELKTLHRHFPHLESLETLKWATLNGAKALQMQTLLGSFEPGKKPGVVLIERAEDGKISPNTCSKKIL